MLKQPQYNPLSVAEQVTILFAANEGILNDVANTEISKFKKEWFAYLNTNLSDLASRLNEGAKLEDADKEEIKQALQNFKKTF